MDKKKRKKIQKGVRFGIQAIFFFMAPALFTSAFSGIKYIVQQLHAGAILSWNPFLTALVLLGGFTILFGRFFCGYACAFGTLGDALYFISAALQKKLKKRLPVIPGKADEVLKKVKYIVLAGIVTLILLGVYDRLSGTSPWDVFSRITSLKLPTRQYLPGILILVAIMVGMIWEERFFCKYLCPMGAVFSILPIFPKSLYERDRENCIRGCSACKRMCPVKLDIDGDTTQSGECIQCNQCVEVCPKSNISLGLFQLVGKGKVHGNELWFIIGKAVLLLAGCYFAGFIR